MGDTLTYKNPVHYVRWPPEIAVWVMVIVVCLLAWGMRDK